MTTTSKLVLFAMICASALTLNAQDRPTLRRQGLPTHCLKSISFTWVGPAGVTPFFPDYVDKWAKNPKNMAKYPGLCFSQDPIVDAANYVVVLSSNQSYFAGFQPMLIITKSVSNEYGSGTITDHYGGRWNYTYNGQVVTTTPSVVDVPYLDTTNTLYAFTYDEDGKMVSQRWRSVTTREGGDPWGTLTFNVSALLFERIKIRTHLLEDTLRDLR